MERYKDNFPRKVNDQFRGNVIQNARMSQKDRETLKKLAREYQKDKQSSEIKHGNSTVEKELKSLRNQVKSQIIGANGNATAEVKDMRVDTKGQLHDLAQDRLNEDFNRIGGIADAAKELSVKHEEQIEESAYYNEINYISGRNFETSYKITYIPHKDKNGDIIKLNRGINGNDPNKPEHITPREFAKQTGATFVSNASTGSGSQMKLHGQQIYNGQILDSIKGDEYQPLNDRWTLAIGDDNSLKSFPPDVQASEIRNQGFNNTVSGFGPLIVEGNVVYKDGDYSEHSNRPEPRQVIAQLPNKDLLFFSCDGRVEAQGLYQRGMTLKEVIDTLNNHYGDIKFAYNLDGGGSTASVLRSKMLNKVTDNGNKSERKVLDFLYVGKEIKQPRDIDIQNAYADIGEMRAFTQFLYGLFQDWNSINSNEMRLRKYGDYTGLVAMDGENPKKKIYMTPDFFSMFDYNSGRTWFKVTDKHIELHNRALARNFSSPETVKDCNNLEYGGTYHVPSNAKGSPYPGTSAAIVEQHNISYYNFKDASTAIQIAYPSIRSAIYKMKRRTYVDGAWSQWFDV